MEGGGMTPVVPKPEVIVPSPAPSIRQVTYFGISIFNSRTFWFNAANLVVAVGPPTIDAILAALSLPEVVAMIPPKYMPLQAAIVAVGNMWLRMKTVRPAVYIDRGDTKPVLVPRLGPPDPGKLGD